MPPPQRSQSLPSSSGTPSETNSLVVTNMPAAFFHPLVLEALRDYFSAFGEIYAWAPITAFARIILVYYSEEDAETAKLACDGVKIEVTSER